MLNRGLAEALGKGDAAKAEQYREAIDWLPQTGKGLGVHDDGDRIMLDDSLGQRLSKVIKRADTGGESERSIARRESLALIALIIGDKLEVATRTVK